jgi:hypothetical protein
VRPFLHSYIVLKRTLAGTTAPFSAPFAGVDSLNSQNSEKIPFSY